MRLRIIALRFAPEHFGGMPADHEAEFTEDTAEHEIMLEAVTAATVIKQFLVEAELVERHRLTKQRTQIFKGDSSGVESMQGVEGLQGRRNGAGEGNAL